VDPALIDELRWMYRTLLDLDRRIAAGGSGQTVQALRDEMMREYLARLSDPAVSGIPAGQAAAGAGVMAGGSPPPAGAPPSAWPPAVPPTPKRPPFSWNAFFAEQSIAIIAYTGAFLLLVATFSFEVGGWQALNAAARLAIVLVVYALFGVAGLALFPRARLRTVSQAYLGIFALMTPLVGLAVYQDALRDTSIPVSGVVSVTAWYTTIVYLALALRTRYPAYSYLGWIVAILAAESILSWAGIGSDWALFTLALAALILLAPHFLHLPAYLARPAVGVSAIASLLLVLLVEIAALSLVSARGAGTTSIGIQPFTLTAVALAGLGVAWMRAARTVWPEVAAKKRADAIEWLSLTTIALGVQAGIAIGGDLQLSASQMGDLLAGLALAAGAIALAYRRWSAEQRITRWGTWGLALTLPVFGWLINVGVPDPNPPLIVALSAGALLSVLLAVVEGSEWWVVYGGLALFLIFHSIVRGALDGARFSGQVEPTAQFLNYTTALTWSHVALVAAFWALALLLTFSPAIRRFSRPVFVVAAVDALYASLLVLILPPFSSSPASQTAALAGFTALALLAGWRVRGSVAGGIVTGVFALLALLPYLTASGSYWQWFLPPLVAAAVALGVRSILGRAYALPLYAVALLALWIGQGRLFADPAASSQGMLGISVAVWFLLLFGLLGIVAAVVERQAWITILPAYCALVAVIATSDQLAGYALTLAVLAIAIALQAWRGRWWNIWLLGIGLLAAMIEVGRFGDTDPGVYALKLGFLAITALAGYALVVLTRDYPETVIAATLLIFLPMVTQSVTSSTPWLFTVILAAEAVVLTGVGVGLRSRLHVFCGSAFVGLAALRVAVLAYSSGVPIAVVIAGMAVVLLAVATWLSVQSRTLEPVTHSSAKPPEA
jgi:hypothetical protein